MNIIVCNELNFACNWQDNWSNLEKPYGSIFLSIPTVLDPSLAPEGHHILHIFTTAGIEDWEVCQCSRVNFVEKFDKPP